MADSELTLVSSRLQCPQEFLILPESFVLSFTILSPSQSPRLTAQKIDWARSSCGSGTTAGTVRGVSASPFAHAPPPYRHIPSTAALTAEHEHRGMREHCARRRRSPRALRVPTRAVRNWASALAADSNSE